MAVEHTDPWLNPTAFAVTITKDVSDRINAKGIPAKETLLNCLQDIQALLSDAIRAVQGNADAVELAKQFDAEAALIAEKRAKVLAAVPAGAKDLIAAEQAKKDAAEIAAKSGKK